MTAPIASGWSGCRVGLAPTGKRRLVTAHAISGSRALLAKRLFRCAKRYLALNRCAIEERVDTEVLGFFKRLGPIRSLRPRGRLPTVEFRVRTAWRLSN